VGTLIQTPLVPDADNEQVARVVLLKTNPDEQVTEACEAMKSLLEKETWPLATDKDPQRIATHVGTLIHATPEPDTAQVANVVLLRA
jgi:predicted oxidoreductase (fatty acid repression mutant protein)